MSETRIKYLDGLRGVLALVVFLHHYLYIFYSDAIFGGQYAEEYLKPGITIDKFLAFTPVNLLFNPGAAIMFFFILSGYVQSFHYFKNPELHIIQKSFFKRYLRLVIPTLAIVLLVYLFHRLHFINKSKIPYDPTTDGWLRSMLPDSLGFFGVIKHALIGCYLTGARYYQVLWTMPVELVNSWMVFILLFVTHGIVRKARVFLIWAVFLAVFMQSYNSTGFVLGTLICYAQFHSEKFLNFFSRTPLKVICCILGIYLASYPFTGYENSSSNTIYAPLSFFEKNEYTHVISYLCGDVLLFLCLLQSPRLHKLFSGTLMQFLGKISFMLYLVHFLLLFSFSPRIYDQLSKHLSRTPNLVLTGLLTFCLTLLISQLLYKYIDKPALRLSGIYLKRWFGL